MENGVDVVGHSVLLVPNYGYGKAKQKQMKRSTDLEVGHGVRILLDFGCEPGRPGR